MSPREEPQGARNSSPPASFTGFVATYEDGTSVLEREGYHSEKLRRPMATSWPEIDRARLTSLDLYWHGEKKATVSKSEQPHLDADGWFFSQTGYMDVSSHTILVIARNIGYRGRDGLLYVTSIRESDGALKGSVRA
jgi:hypothetical protein